MTRTKTNGGVGWTPIFAAIIVSIGIFVVLWAVGGQADDLDRAETRVQTLEDNANTSDDVIAALAVQVERLCGDRPNCEPIVSVDPEIQDGEIQDLEIQDIEIQEPERQEPENQQPDRNDADPDDPEAQDPESQDPETQDPEVDDPDINDPEFDDPEQQEPEQQDPEQQDPEIDDPDPDDPDPNDEMDTFTFTWINMTFVCTDPDNDRQWSCEPA